MLDGEKGEKGSCSRALCRGGERAGGRGGPGGAALWRQCAAWARPRSGRPSAAGRERAAGAGREDDDGGGDTWRLQNNPAKMIFEQQHFHEYFLAPKQVELLCKFLWRWGKIISSSHKSFRINLRVD